MITQLELLRVVDAFTTPTESTNRQNYDKYPMVTYRYNSDIEEAQFSRWPFDDIFMTPTEYDDHTLMPIYRHFFDIEEK